MTTENGISHPKEVAKHIKHLRKRIAYIESRIRHGQGNIYYERELAAMAWAMPILEAEQDWIRTHTIYAYDRRRNDEVAIDEKCPACGAHPGQIRKRGYRVRFAWSGEGVAREESDHNPEDTPTVLDGDEG
jgi:hypothetical protein